MSYKNVSKAVILAGGKGTRIAEETHNKPKPMIEIGARPILWHIMKTYDYHGIREFVICLGYKGYQIKEYFMNYAAFRSDITVDTSSNNEANITFHRNDSEDWKITLANTGEDTMTGGRIKKIGKYLNPDEPFCLTYGDGVSDINIAESIDFHNGHGKLATVSGVRPNARFGALELSGNEVVSFKEKPEEEGGFINGGYFVLSPKVLDYIKDDDQVIWEKEPLENITNEGEMAAFLHEGFWQPMDTLRDHTYLSDLWEQHKAPWKVW